MNRRDFIYTTSLGIAAQALTAMPLDIGTTSKQGIKAVAFDAFAIFDPRPIFALVTQMFPEKGAELANLWRTKQFEYTWLRTAAGQYKDFWKVTQDALVYAAHKTGLTLTEPQTAELMGQYLQMQVWPDVIPVLKSLKEKGIRLAFLSNITQKMLTASAHHAQIHTYFEHFISTDAAKTYKPSVKAYALAPSILKLKKEEILFVAFAGWDASGAKWYGYPTYWSNRLDTPKEELDTTVEASAKNIQELLDLEKNTNLRWIEK